MRFIDSILNKVTMYRLLIYVLFFLLAIAALFGWLGLMAINPIDLAFSTAFIFLICWVTNRLFAHFFEAPTNYESTWLTALILALIISPPTAFLDTNYLALAFWASAMAIASKYIFAIKKKHIFNPAAFGVAVTGVVLGLSASWWVGTLIMAPFVLAAGLLVVRKIHRFDLWWAFIITFLGGQMVYALLNAKDLLNVLNQSIFNAPILFFSTVMLTEPLTTPPTRYLRIIYGALVGFLFLPNVHINVLYFTPELALIAGNIFSYLVSSKDKLILRLKQAIELSPDVYEFAFATDKNFKFKPGQYMEWTLFHHNADLRGMRRFFTISSSPTEKDIKLGVKFYEPSSTYKKEMLQMKPEQRIVAAQLAGDFTLPRDKDKKLVFIAGGIGVTPFRSMIQYLMDKGERRHVTLLYQNKAPVDAVYRELFERAQYRIGLKYVNVFNKLDAETIKREVPDWMGSTFYISGPQAMVSAYKDLLRAMGVPRLKIKTDYFPGF